jgi:DNA-binding transcriptional ArsR family regulator
VSAPTLQLIAEPRRQRILRMCWTGEHAAGDIAASMPEVTFGAVSQHLHILHRAGALRVRRDGRRRLYTADRASLGELAPVLEQLWFGHLTKLKALAESDQRAIDAHPENPPCPPLPPPPRKTR